MTDDEAWVKAQYRSVPAKYLDSSGQMQGYHLQPCLSEIFKRLVETEIELSRLTIAHRTKRRVPFNWDV